MLPNNAKNIFADKAYCRLENFLFYTRRLTHFVQCMFISKVFLQAVPRERPTKTAHYPPSWSHIDICLQGSQNATHIPVPSIRFRRLTRLLSTANNNHNEKWEMLKSSLQTHQIFKQRSTQALVHATYTTLQKRKEKILRWNEHNMLGHLRQRERDRVSERRQKTALKRSKTRERRAKKWKEA